MNSYSSANKPLPTIMKGNGVQYFDEQNKRTYVPLEVLIPCASFPHDFKFVGRVIDAINRIGNSVPPNLMRAIAEHIRQNILAKV